MSAGVRVVPAERGDFERVEPLLVLLGGARISRERWRGLFDYPWPWPGAERGHLLLDGERVVGFFGTVWSRRRVRGEEHAVCNLSSWVTLPEYRNHSLLLLKAVLARRDCTITCHSPARELHGIYRKFGFSDLETHVVALRNLPPPRSWLPFPRSRLARSASDAAGMLAGTQREIFEHHRGLPCGQFVVGDEGGRCHVIYTRTRGARAWWAQVQYVSDAAVFARNLPAARRALMLGARTPFASIERRLLGGVALRGGRECALGTPHVFRSPALAAAEVDALYSEVLLLGL